MKTEQKEGENITPVTRNNLLEGSCTVLLGPRRSLKTQLTFDFLRDGGREEQLGLLVSCIDNQGTIVAQHSYLCDQDCKAKNAKERLACTEAEKKCTTCYKNVYLFHFPPGCITSSEWFHWIEKRLREAENNGRPIKRLVFWDLAQLQDRFPLLAKDPMFLPGLMDYLKNSKSSKVKLKDGKPSPRNITSLFMGAPNTDLGRSASAMADNVLFTWRDRSRTKHNFQSCMEFSKESEGTEKLEVGREGVAVYVNRIEGQPGRNPLFFIPDPDKGKEFRDNERMVPVMPSVQVEMTGSPSSGGTRACV